MIVLNENARKNEKNINLENIIKEDMVMKEYRRDAEIASMDDEVIGMYDKELEDEILMNARMEDIKEEGKKEGKIEGKIEGKKEGILSVAIEMIKSNFSVKDISNCTGLSKKEIEKISYNL